MSAATRRMAGATPAWTPGRRSAGGSRPCWPSRCTGSRCGTIRRRSPGTSRQALQARKPKVMFIEGPHEAND